MKLALISLLLTPPLLCSCSLLRSAHSIGEVETVTQSIPAIVRETLLQTAAVAGRDFQGLERIQVEVTADRVVAGELGVTIPLGSVPLGASLGASADRGIKIVIQIKDPKLLLARLERGEEGAVAAYLDVEVGTLEKSPLDRGRVKVFVP